MTMKFRVPLLSLVLSLCGLFIQPAAAQSFGDTLIQVPAAYCPGAVSAGTAVAATGAPAVGTGLQILTTPFMPVYQVSSTAAAATHTYTCDLSCPFARATTGKGCSAVAGFVFFYDVLTTTATSESAPVCGTVTPPVPAAAETSSAAAFVSVPITSLPVVGSANLTADTVGKLVSTYLSITTPPALPSTGVYQKLFCTIAFGQTGASAMVTYTPGGTIFTTNTIAWLRQHPKNALAALVRIGIDRKQARTILAHYRVKGFNSRPA